MLSRIARRSLMQCLSIFTVNLRGQCPRGSGVAGVRAPAAPVAPTPLVQTTYSGTPVSSWAIAIDPNRHDLRQAYGSVTVSESGHKLDEVSE